MARKHTLESATRQVFQLVLKYETTELPFVAIKLIETEGIFWVYVQSFADNGDVVCSAIYDTKNMIEWLSSTKAAIEAGINSVNKE